METKWVVSVPTNQLPCLITEQHLLNIISIVSSSFSLLLNIISKTYPHQREPKAQGQTCTKTGDIILSRLSLPDIFSFYQCQKTLEAAEMKVRRLKMSRHV